VYSLGVEEVADGTAVSSLDSFIRRLESLLRSARVSNLNDELRSVLLKIQACLSDRCPVELKWNRLLQERKFELVQQHYASLPFDAQVDMARVFSFFCMAHALSGMTEVIPKLFQDERKDLTNVLYSGNTVFDATRELCKSFHAHSKWGFMLFPAYVDFCELNNCADLERATSIGRFVGSRSHNQFLPALKAYNARGSLLAFLTFWEGRKTTQAPNHMFTSNKKALRCKRTLFEFEVVGLVYAFLIRFMLSVMAGHTGNITSNLGLVPVVGALVDRMAKPSLTTVRRIMRGQEPLIPLFGAVEPGSKPLPLPGFISVLVVGYVAGPPDEACRDALIKMLEIDETAFFLAHFTATPAHEEFLLKALPAMSAVLCERQPHLAPGGAYAAATPTPALMAAGLCTETTSDKLESDLGIADHNMLQKPSILVETVSLHVKLSKNDTFESWFWKLSKEERRKYLCIAKILAKVKHKEQKVQRARMTQIRAAKAQLEATAADEYKEKKVNSACDANLHAWQNETQLNSVFVSGKRGKARGEDAIKKDLVKQVTYFKQLDLFPAQAKGWAASKETNSRLVEVIRTCIQARAAAAAAPSSSASASSTVLPDSDGSDEDSDVEPPYIMPCCKAVWTEGVAVVECSECMEWCHLQPLAECPGEGITRQRASAKKYKHVCRLCAEKDA